MTTQGFPHHVDQLAQLIRAGIDQPLQELASALANHQPPAAAAEELAGAIGEAVATAILEAHEQGVIR